MIAQTDPPSDLLSTLQKSLGHRFSDPKLPMLALTHSSLSNEKGEEDNYERLEFLGDAVLGLVASQWLYRRFPKAPEGQLAKLKSFVVSAPALADFANSVHLGQHLRLGVGEERSGGREKTSILADCLEALFGAIYLDGGLDAAQPLVERVVGRALERRSVIRHNDAKTRLQELTQGKGLGLPAYSMVAESGPDHRKRFTVEVRLEGRLIGCAEGRSKKTAEQAAAANALATLPELQPELS
ncbi:MAG: ribonuclease III [Acidobacteriota bacterium]